ncbi:MAG: hypothetical protein HWE30_15015 [Methylocystaceae bacterium]|nr:hypothetical protein [Methylocystaceae bacterium]
MMKYFMTALLLGSLSLSLSACGEEEKVEKTEPAKQVEQAAPKKAESPKTENDRDMTPAEALDNMKRDAGIVADKAVDAYNAAKDAITSD